MLIEDWLAGARLRRLAIVNCLAIGLLAAGLFSLFAPKQYASYGAVYVLATNRQITSSDLYEGTMLVRYRMPTYENLATSRRVLAPVIEQLSLATTVRELASRITVVREKDSASLLLTALDARPARAKAIVDALTAQLIATAAELERVGDADPPVEIRVQSEGSTPEAPVAPANALNLLIGFAAGLVSALLIVTVTAIWIWRRRQQLPGCWIYLADETTRPRLVLAKFADPAQHAAGQGAEPPLILEPVPSLDGTGGAGR